MDSKAETIVTPATSLQSGEGSVETNNSGAASGDNADSLGKINPGSQEPSNASSASKPAQAEERKYVYLHCIEVNGQIRYQFGSISEEIGVRNDRRFKFWACNPKGGTWSLETVLQYKTYNWLNHRLKFTLDQPTCEEINSDRTLAILEEASKIEKEEDVPGYQAVMESIKREGNRPMLKDEFDHV